MDSDGFSEDYSKDNYNSSETFPDITQIEWIPVETIFNSWLSVDSSEIRLGAQERTYEEWMLLLNRTRGDCQIYDYSQLIELIQTEGFIIPLPFRTNEDGDRVKCNGHHRLVVAYDLGYKYIPYVHVREGEAAYFDINDFESLTLKTLIHPENPMPTNPQ